MIYVPEVVGRIVDAMRKYGSYSSHTNVGTLYTIVAKNTLVENEWVLILDTQASTLGFDYFFPIIFTDDLPDLTEDATVFSEQSQQGEEVVAPPSMMGSSTKS